MRYIETHSIRLSVWVCDLNLESWILNLLDAASISETTSCIYYANEISSHSNEFSLDFIILVTISPLGWKIVPF